MQELIEKINGLTNMAIENLKEQGIEIRRVHPDITNPKQQQCLQDHQGQCGICDASGGWTGC